MKRTGAVSEPSTRKRVVVDTSSVILLIKSDLMDPLVRLYKTLLPSSVFEELTVGEFPDTKPIKRYKKRHLISLIPDDRKGDPLLPDCPSLDRGERDVIRAYQNGRGDFILLDDGKAARYCFSNGIPFINALLVAKILHWNGQLTTYQYQKKTQRLLSIGRYSEKIEEMADRYTREELTAFLP